MSGLDIIEVSQKIVLQREAIEDRVAERDRIDTEVEQMRRDLESLKKVVEDAAPNGEVAIVPDSHGTQYMVSIEAQRRGSWVLKPAALERDAHLLTALGLAPAMVKKLPTVTDLRKHKRQLSQHGLNLDDYVVKPPYCPVVTITKVEDDEA